MSVDILWRAAETAEDEYTIFQASNALSIMDVILLNEAQQVIHDVNAILKQHIVSQNEQVLFDNLKTYLSKRWDDIAGDYLSYTNCPNSTATQLCLKIAQWLHQQDNSKSVYQYMMPTLTATLEILNLFEANVDDLKLSQVILSEDKTSLIPSRLIGYLSLSLNTNFDSLAKPYVQKAGEVPSKLTDKERTALIEHSRLSKTFYKHYDDICAYQETSLSLGGEIYNLIKGLREGGQHGPYGGTASVAADIAYEAIDRFMSYWNLLEDDLKDKVKTLRANDDSHSLEEIINILIKVDDKSLDCVEVNAEKLELLLKAHPNLYTQGQDNPAFLKKISDEFYDLKKQFDIKDGVDGHERCPLGAYCLNFIDADFTAKLQNNELMGIIKKYNGHAPALVRLICQTPGVLTQEMLLNADSKGFTPLMWAVKYRYTDIVKLILEKTDDLAVINAADKDGQTPLLCVAGYAMDYHDDHIEIVKLILEKTNDLAVINAKDKVGWTPLLMAAVDGVTKMAKLILEKTNDLAVINAKDTFGKTPLLWAAFKGHTEIVKLILEKTNDLAVINAREPRGRTPLTWAADRGHTEIVKLVLEKMDDLAVINAKDNSGKTPLMYAVNRGHIEIAKRILEKTDDLAVINAKDVLGYTPLMYAVEKGRIEVVELILEKTDNMAVINATDGFNKTPLTLATKQGRNDIVKLIQEKIAELPLEARIKQLKLLGPRYNALTDAVVELQNICTSFPVHAEMKKKGSPQTARVFPALFNQTPVKIVDATVKFLDNFLAPNFTQSKKLRLIKDYENTIQPYKTLKTVGKCLGVVVVAALCAATGAAIGLGAGFLAGAWTGPGAIVTAFAGLLTGTATAWTVGVSVGAGVAGISGAAVANYVFFKPAPIQQAISEVVQTARWCAMN